MTARRWALGAGLALAIAVVTQLEIWAPHALLRPNTMPGPHAAVSVAYALAVLGVLVRVRIPLAAVVLTCVPLCAEWIAFASPESFGSFILPVIASYSVAAHSDRRPAMAGLAIVVATAITWFLTDPSQTTFQKQLGALLWLAPIPLAWLAAAYVRRRRLREQRDAATLAQIEREERARSAVEDERARIARELHDAVGHSVSVMTVQASAVRRLLTPEQKRELDALIAVEQTGREALAEMRRMVGVLRTADDAPALAPQPGLDQLEKLIAKVRDAGLPVCLRVEGEAAALPAGVDLTAYRLVQEGLTNALKHSGAQHAEVLLRYEPAAIEIAITDDGGGATATSEEGHGLIGMRERVSVFGGELSARSLDRGGFELRARLPLTA